MANKKLRTLQLIIVFATILAVLPSVSSIEILNQDNYEDKGFIIEVYSNKQTKLTADHIEWVKAENTTKFYPRLKQARTLNELHFKVNQLASSLSCIPDNTYYSTCSSWNLRYEDILDNNIITKHEITPILNKEVEPEEIEAYWLSFYGDITDTDPYFNLSYTSSTEGFYDQTEASALGVRLIYNGTDEASGGYNSTSGNFRYFVFYNQSSTYWNITLNLVDSNGSNEVHDLCNNDANCISYWDLGTENTDANPYNDEKGNNDGTPTGTNNATGISSGAMRFDGSGNHINITEVSLSDSFTLSLWKNTEEIATDYLMILGNYDDNDYWAHRIGSNRINFRCDGETEGTIDIDDNFGEWEYWTLTYDSGTINYYVNGEYFDTDVDSGADCDFDITLIGTGHSSPYYWHGWLDEVMFYNDSLTASEVEDLYKAGLSQHVNTNITLETRTADSYNISDANLVYLFGFNSNTSQSNDVQICDSHDSCVSIQGTWNPFGSTDTYNDVYRYNNVGSGADYVNYSFTPTTTGTYYIYQMGRVHASYCSNTTWTDDVDTSSVDRGQNDGSKWEYVGEAEYTASTEYIIQANDNCGLSFAWADAYLITNDNESFSYDDEVGGKGIGYSRDNTSSANGVIGKCLDVDGTVDDGAANAYIDLDDSMDGTALSFSIWINPDSTTGYRTIIGTNDDTYADGVLLGIDDGLPTVYIDTSTGDYAWDFSGLSIETDKWQHLAMTWNNDIVTVYLNGESEEWDVTGTGIEGSNGLAIGDVGNMATFDGEIDEVRIYNKTLSAAEVQNLYELGSYHIEWNDWDSEGKVEDLVPLTSTSEGSFMQFKAVFDSDSTTASPYILNHTITMSGATATSANEAEARTAIETGINNALASPTIYTDQQIYLRDKNNNQDLGTFDKLASSNNQRWAINYITDGESYTNMFNITPVIYVLELTDLTTTEITTQVEEFINITEI